MNCSVPSTLRRSVISNGAACRCLAGLRSRLMGAIMLLLSGFPASSCADKVPTNVPRSCPCAAGNVCCSSGVCAPSQDACVEEAMGLTRDAQGVWTGYFENFTFQSGSDDVKIALSLNGDQITAEVKMGAEGVPEPSIDSKADGSSPFYDAGGMPGFEVKEGFTYRATEVRWENERLKITVALGDAWKEWCASYPPVMYMGHTFYCPPREWEWGAGSECSIAMGWGVPHEVVDCALLEGCFLDHCGCTENSCEPTQAKAKLDIALRGDTADGSADLGGHSIWTSQPILFNVRLTRTSR